jgi:protein-glutamine gamma-glutamyltransferase
MNPPPFLLLATLLFWGWESNLLIAGAIMGVILESARWVKIRWDLSDEDLGRIWTFCILLTFVIGVYLFSTDENGGLSHFKLGVNGAASATASMAHAGSTTMRWLPMSLFLFLAAQQFSERGKVPLSVISWVFRRRLQKGLGETTLNVAYPYFIVCLFSAGIHNNTGTQSYYWGISALLAWALWTLRAKRFGVALWVAMLALSLVVGFGGQFGLGWTERWLAGSTMSWMQRFFQPKPNPLEAETSIGQIGQMKLSGNIVVRLTPHDRASVPEYLREASYRAYRNQRWLAGSLGIEYDRVSEFPANTWGLLPGRTNHSVVSIACYLTEWNKELSIVAGLLPLPDGCDRLEQFHAVEVKKNPFGVVMASGPGLAMYDVRFGPGATIDSPPDVAGTNQFDLLVPTNEVPALEQVLQELSLPADASFEQKRRAIQAFFTDKFSYTTWLGVGKAALTNNETPLGHFLLVNRRGHCEYFATATVLLLRKLHVPARYAIGYLVHEPRGKGYVVRARDGHAWCLVWNEAAKTWENFDTTPASWVAEEGKRANFAENFSDAWSWVKFQFSKFRWGQTNLRQYILMAMVPVLLFLAYQIIFRRRKRRAGAKQSLPSEILWPGRDSEFYQLAELLAARGVPRLTGETLAAWLERALADQTLAGFREPLTMLLRLHYRLRFDPAGLTPAEREQLARETAQQMERLRQKDSGNK